MNERQLARFLPKIDFSGECWLWVAAKDVHGYGRFGIWADGRTVPYLAHRVCYEHYVGPIPEGLTLDHLCKNPPCVNPDHLEPVTQAENVRRGRGADLWRNKTHCPSGHPYSPENTLVNARGSRECRACRNAADRARYHRKRATQNALAS